MASAFKTSVAGLEKELAALITDNQIQVMNRLCFLASVVCLVCFKFSSLD
jgi:hypothetical protein